MAEDEKLTPELVHKQADEVALKAWKEQFPENNPSIPLNKSLLLTPAEKARVLKSGTDVKKNETEGRYDEDSDESRYTPISDDEFEETINGLASNAPKLRHLIETEGQETEEENFPERQKLKETYKSLASALDKIGITSEIRESGISKDVKLIGVDGSFYITSLSTRHAGGERGIHITREYQSTNGITAHKEMILEPDGSCVWRSRSGAIEEKGRIGGVAEGNPKVVLMGSERMVNVISVAIAENPPDKIHEKLRECRNKLVDCFNLGERTYQTVVDPETNEVYEAHRYSPSGDKELESEIRVIKYDRKNGIWVPIAIYTISENGDADFDIISSEKYSVHSFIRHNEGGVDAYELRNSHRVLIEFQQLTTRFAKPQEAQSKAEEKPQESIETKNNNKSGLRGFLRRFGRNKT